MVAGEFDPKLQVEGDVSHQPFLVLENYMNCRFIQHKNVSRDLFRFVTIHVSDRQTDRQMLIGKSACIQCSAVKINTALKQGVLSNTWHQKLLHLGLPYFHV